MGFYDNENDDDNKKPEARDMGDVTDVTPREMDDYTSASSRINPVKTSRFTKKQIILGVGGSLFGAALLWAVMSPNPVPESPAVQSQPASIASGVEAQQSQNMMGQQVQQPLPSTLMGSNEAGAVDAPFPPSQMPPQQQDVDQPVAVVPVAPVEAIAAPVVAVAPQTTTPAVAPAPAPRVVVEKVIEKDPALLKKIAVLEKRVAELVKEAEESKEASAKPKAAAPKSKPAVASYQARTSPQKKSTKSQRRTTSEDETDGMTMVPKAVAVTKTPPVSDGDHVRVIGLTKRSTGTTALIEFAGVKHRVSQGDSVPGLGKVSQINQAGGSPSVQINGVTYH